MDDLQTRAKKIIEKLDITSKKKRIRELELESSQSSFWNDHQTAGKKMKELSTLQKEVDEADMLQLMVDEGQLEDAEELIDKMEMLLYFSWNCMMQVEQFWQFILGKEEQKQWIGQKCFFVCILVT